MTHTCTGNDKLRGEVPNTNWNYFDYFNYFIGKSEVKTNENPQSNNVRHLILQNLPVSSERSMSISLLSPCPVLLLIMDSKLTTEHIGLQTKDWLSAYLTTINILGSSGDSSLIEALCILDRSEMK